MSERMTIRDIAGFCPEDAVWKMIADVSGCLINEKFGYELSPDSIMIDCFSFMLNSTQEMTDDFQAPEHNNGQKPNKEETVWSLGAVAYYAATGHIVFGGHGGDYQREHPTVSLPVLPKGMQNLTPVLQKCLCYRPEERVGLQELNNLAQNGLMACGRQAQKETLSDKKIEINKEIKYTGEKWPEEMIEV